MCALGHIPKLTPTTFKSNDGGELYQFVVILFV